MFTADPATHIHSGLSDQAQDHTEDAPQQQQQHQQQHQQQQPDEGANEAADDVALPAKQLLAAFELGAEAPHCGPVAGGAAGSAVAERRLKLQKLTRLRYATRHHLCRKQYRL